MARTKKEDPPVEKTLKIPKGEESWVGYYNSNGERIFLLTSKEGNREWYYLYEVINGTELKKLGKSHSPIELEQKFKVIEKMRA